MQLLTKAWFLSWPSLRPWKRGDWQPQGHLLWLLGHVRELGSNLEKVFFCLQLQPLAFCPLFMGRLRCDPPPILALSSCVRERQLWPLLVRCVPSSPCCCWWSWPWNWLKRRKHWRQHVQSNGQSMWRIWALKKCFMWGCWIGVTYITCKTLQDHFFLIESDNLDTSCRTSTMHNTLTRGKTKARNREVHSI